MKRTLLSFYLLSNAYQVALAQEESQGQIGTNPPSIHWRQIQTPTGKVIFPEGLDSVAARVAGIMNYEKNHDLSIIGAGTTKQVPVILQNLSTLPAGFSTPAPWRNEYFLTPPQNFFAGAVPWLDILTTHEYRHAQQFSAANTGFTRAYQVLMGQTGWLFNSVLTQPLWYREGDAVTNETIFTNAGRGRLPAFHMEYRAMRLSGYHYNYEKAHFSSLKDFIPNPYRTGYYMVTKARRDYGEDIWKNVLTDTYGKTWIFYPFSRSLKKFTGNGTKSFYNATVTELDSIFENTDKNIQPTASREVFSEDSKIYTNWRFPHYLADGTVVSLRNSFNEIQTYYQIGNDGKRHHLFSPGVYTDDHRTSVVEGNLMTWCESSFNERWFNKDYSIVKAYDFSTGKTRKVTSKSRYFSPSPSPDGSRLAVVSNDLMGKSSIVIIDSKKGAVQKTLPNSGNVSYAQLRWADNNHVVGMALAPQGNTIMLIDVESGTEKILLDYTSVDISRPFASGDYIFFSAGFTGIDNIYALHIPTKKVWQVTNVRFGAFEPCASPDGKKLLYAEYTADGYRIKEIPLEPSSWKAYSTGFVSDIRFHEPLFKTEGKNLSLVSFDSTYQARKYNALTDGLFNFYGWFPIPNIPEYGAEFYTQNIMSTLRGTIGILYNTNENNLHSYVRLTYAALYPVIDLQYEYGLNRKGKVFDNTTLLNKEIEWTENIASGGITLPFRLTQGTHITRLSISGWYAYYDVNALDTTNLEQPESHYFFSSIKPTLQFSRLRTQARREVKPRWGQVISASFQQALNDDPQRLVGVAQLYFPGIVRTHSLNFSLSYKKEEVVNTYRFRDDFIMPRGYKPAPFESQYGIYCNYEFPIWYPDISVSSVAFFQRLRMNLFYDYSIGRVEEIEKTLSSTGAELYVDFRLFRLVQMSMGLRYNLTFNDNTNERTAPVQFLVTRFELAN